MIARALLALMMASCPLLMPSASAAAAPGRPSAHACCAGKSEAPAAKHHRRPASSDDCCLRAQAPSQASFAPAPLRCLGPLPAFALLVPALRTSPRFTGSSPPPDDPRRAPVSGRAPPAVA